MWHWAYVTSTKLSPRADHSLNILHTEVIEERLCTPPKNSSGMPRPFMSAKFVSFHQNLLKPMSLRFFVMEKHCEDNDQTGIPRWGVSVGTSSALALARAAAHAAVVAAASRLPTICDCFGLLAVTPSPLFLVGRNCTAPHPQFLPASNQPSRGIGILQQSSLNAAVLLRGWTTTADG